MCGACPTPGARLWAAPGSGDTRVCCVLRALLESTLLLRTTLPPVGLHALMQVLDTDTEGGETTGTMEDRAGSGGLQHCTSQLAQVWACPILRLFETCHTPPELLLLPLPSLSLPDCSHAV